MGNSSVDKGKWNLIASLGDSEGIAFNDGFSFTTVFCWTSRKDLEQLGFKVYLHDVCVANKMINGEQFAVL